MQVRIFTGKPPVVQEGINKFLGDGTRKNIGGFINLSAGPTAITVMCIYEPIAAGAESQMPPQGPPA